MDIEPKMKRKKYEAELSTLQAELVAMQEWVKASGRKDYTEYRLAIGELKRLAKRAQPAP